MTKKKPPVDWLKVERIMRNSVTGRGVTSDEQKMVEQAYAADPEAYHERYACIRDEEQALMKRGGRWF